MLRRCLVATACGLCGLWTAVCVAGPGSGEPGSGISTLVSVYDPTGQSPAQIAWPPYPATPPTGYHWEDTGSPAIVIDPASGQPVPGRPTGGWILVRDGYSMPRIR